MLDAGGVKEDEDIDTDEFRSSSRIGLVLRAGRICASLPVVNGSSVNWNSKLRLTASNVSSAASDRFESTVILKTRLLILPKG